MSAAGIALVGLLVFLYALVSRRTSSWPLTMPMVFVAAGALLSSTDLVSVDADIEAVGVIAELALSVFLFSDAVRIDIGALRENAAFPSRLLLVGLPLTIIAGTGVNALLFPGLALVEVALLAAILSPTDAALGSAVVEDPQVPRRERLSLNVESGLNDGLVVPVVTVLTILAVDGGTSARSVLRIVVEKLGFGLAVGAAVGFGAIVLLSWVHERGWSDGRYEQIGTFVLPVVAYTGAEALDGSGFIAAFVAGVLFGAAGRQQQAEHYAEFTEDAAQLLGLAAFFIFGNLFVGEAIGSFDPAVFASALLSLTLVRIVPVWLSQLGAHQRWPTTLFVGWFGPRGLASIVFGIILLEDAAEIGPGVDELLGVINVTVTASVFLHGATAAWGARTYGQWAATVAMSDEHRARMYLPEMEAASLPAPRWSRRRPTATNVPGRSGLDDQA